MDKYWQTFAKTANLRTFNEGKMKKKEIKSHKLEQGFLLKEKQNSTGRFDSLPYIYIYSHTWFHYDLLSHA